MADEVPSCGCCGFMVKPRDPDPWEGRMDAYCYSCALTRCDAYPGECGRNRAYEPYSMRAPKELPPEVEALIERTAASKPEWRDQPPSNASSPVSG